MATVKMYAVMIDDEEHDRYYEKDIAEEIAHELTHQGDPDRKVKIVEVEQEEKPLPKFELQRRSKPGRTCGIDYNDRSTCCGGEIFYFEKETVFDDRGPLTLGGYEGCEFCGAVAPQPKRKKRTSPPMMFD
jgi:hypothetical protein